MSADELDRIRGEVCCCQSPADPCDGDVQAHHHTGRRGLGQKATDREAFPLCAKHHHDFHAARGIFYRWSHEDRRQWQDAMVELYWPDDLDGAELPF